MIRLDSDLIHHALQTASDHGFAGVEIGLGDDRFEAKLMPRRPALKKPVDADGDEIKDLKTIAASAVGYYRSTKRILEVGTEVVSGEIVAEIVALGLANEVLSKWSGTVTEVFVVADQPVEYGQAIATIEVKHG